MTLVSDAVDSGCCFKVACYDLEVTPRTLRRWQKDGVDDKRRGPLTTPRNKLSEQERAAVIEVCTSAEFCDLSPSQIVPRLADRGEYLASEATMYRILREERLLAHRARTKPPKKRVLPTHQATAPNMLYSWDITFLPTRVKGMFFKGYLFMDIFSRKIVGARVHFEESSELAALLFKDICREEAIPPGTLVLHSDNGSPMRGASLTATLAQLGVASSYSRPSVSNDNAYSESLFKTLKYAPEYPRHGFYDLMEAQAWLDRFVRWYNDEHRHSGIQYVTPSQRHRGEDRAILCKRRKVYADARRKNPHRWSGKTRNWDYIDTVFLNPRKEKNRKGDAISNQMN